MAALAPKHRATRNPYSRPCGPEDAVEERPRGPPTGVQVAALALVEHLGSVQEGVIEGTQRGRGPVGRGQRPGVRVPAHGGSEPTGTFGGTRRHTLPAPGQRGRRLREGQRRGVLRPQPPLGRGTGVPAQPWPGESVLRMIEGGGEGDATGGRRGGPDGIEKSGDGVVHSGDGLPLPVEPIVPDDRTGRGKEQPQREQPSRSGDEGKGPQPPRLGQRHPGPDGGRDQQLRTGGGGDGADGTDASGDEPEAGEDQGQHEDARAVTGVRPDEHPARPRDRWHPEPPDRRPLGSPAGH